MSTEEHINQLTAQVAALRPQLAHHSQSPPPPQPSAAPAPKPPKVATLSRTAPGCVTRHTRHASVTHFRPILGNIVEVTLVTSPNLYINSHTKGTGFPSVRITIMIPL